MPVTTKISTFLLGDPPKKNLQFHLTPLSRESVVVLYLGALSSTVEGLDFIARARLYNDLQAFEKKRVEKNLPKTWVLRKSGKKNLGNKPVKNLPSLFQLDPKGKVTSKIGFLRFLWVSMVFVAGFVAGFFVGFSDFCGFLWFLLLDFLILI